MNSDAVSTICAELDDLIECYALGSLETEDLLFVSDNLDRCPPVAERLHEYEEAVGLLGLAVPIASPSPGIWMRLESATRPQNVTELHPSSVRGVTMPRWAAALASAAALLLLVATISLGVALQQSNDDDQPTDETVAEYLMAGGEMIRLNTWAAPEWMTWPGRGTLITAPDMPPIVIVDKCAPTGDSDWDYVVWLRIGDERTPMGQMEINEDGKGIMQLEGIDSLENYDAIGISIRKGEAKFYDVMEGSPKQSG